MLALGLLGVALLGSALAWGAFVWADVVAAFDGDPDTHTASELIQAWRRAHGAFGFLALLVPLILLGGGVALLVLYLFIHLELELV